MKIFPAIDILNEKCVRLFKGDYNKATVYSEDPNKMINKWSEHGAEWIHIVDLDGARKGKPISKALITKMIDNSSVKIQIGGGIRDLDSIEYYLSNGVERVILGSVAIENKNDFVNTAVSKYGSDRIIISVDSENGFVKSDGWIKSSKISPKELISNMLSSGVTNFIYTDIEKDGTFQGVSIETIESIKKEYHLNLIVAGGISSIDDIQKLEKLNVEGVIIGKAFYENYLNPSIISQYK